jgi:hypothetical protein
VATVIDPPDRGTGTLVVGGLHEAINTQLVLARPTRLNLNRRRSVPVMKSFAPFSQATFYERYEPACRFPTRF